MQEAGKSSSDAATRRSTAVPAIDAALKRARET